MVLRCVELAWFDVILMLLLRIGLRSVVYCLFVCVRLWLCGCVVVLFVWLCLCCCMV